MDKLLDHPADMSDVELKYWVTEDELTTYQWTLITNEILHRRFENNIESHNIPQQAA